MWLRDLETKHPILYSEVESNLIDLRKYSRLLLAVVVAAAAVVVAKTRRRRRRAEKSPQSLARDPFYWMRDSCNHDPRAQPVHFHSNHPHQSRRLHLYRSEPQQARAAEFHQLERRNPVEFSYRS